MIDGRRTPFQRAGTGFAELTTLDLACAAVSGLLDATGVDPARVELLVLGRVISDPRTSNLAREVVFGTELPDSCLAHTLSVACVSSLQSTLDAARAILAGDAGLAIAGGVESLSDAPRLVSRPLQRRLAAMASARGARKKLGLLRGLRPRDFATEGFAIAELSTGETMGQNAERLAARLGIGRDAQDALAYESHTRAARAREEGWLARQIAPVPAAPDAREDNGIRGDTTLEKLASLRSVYDAARGTITAGNASYLTDGASAVLLASEETVDELGLEPSAWIEAWSSVAREPRDELLVGPAFAAPRALDRAGLDLADCGVLELHEAFAAQVLAVASLLEDAEFGREALGRSGPVGEVDRATLNAWGGSLSVGHPFGATGARLLTTACHRMEHEGAERALVSACAGGSIGTAIVLRRA